MVCDGFGLVPRFLERMSGCVLKLIRRVNASKILFFSPVHSPVKTHTNASMKVGYTHHISIILSGIDAQLDFDQFHFISLAFPDASFPSARAPKLGGVKWWGPVARSTFGNHGQTCSTSTIMAWTLATTLWVSGRRFIQSWKDDNRGFAIKQWNLNLCQVCFTYMFVVSVVCRHSIHSLGSSWCMMCLVMPNMPSWKWCWVSGDYFLLSELDSFGRPSYALYLWLDLIATWVSGKTHRIHGIAQMPVSIRFQLHAAIETKKPFSWIHWFAALDLLLKFHMLPTRLHWNLGTSWRSRSPTTDTNHQPPFIPPKPQAFWRFKPPSVPSTVASCRLS